MVMEAFEGYKDKLKVSRLPLIATSGVGRNILVKTLALYNFSTTFGDTVVTVMKLNC